MDNGTKINKAFDIILIRGNRLSNCRNSDTNFKKKKSAKLTEIGIDI